MPKVLIIEDNRKLALFIKQYLQKRGFESDLSFDGLHGLESFTKESYDLLLVDLRLPVLDGKSFCRKVRAAKKGNTIPIILMSAHVGTDPSDSLPLKEALGLDEILAKPFSFDKLYEAITGAVYGKSAVPPREKRSGSQDSLATRTPTTVNKTYPTGHFSGSLEKIPFDRVLYLITEKKMTGIIHVEKEADRRDFYFIGGNPAEFISSNGQNSFGRYLFDKGLASIVELRCYGDLIDNNKTDPRDIFIKMGCLTAESFNTENKSYIKNHLIECFSWNQGKFIFEPQTTFLPPGGISSPALSEVFYLGFKRCLSPPRLSRFLNEKGNLYIGKSHRFHDFQNQFEARNLSDSIFASLNGLKNTSQLIDSINSDDEEILIFLFTLDYLGMVTFTKKPVKDEIMPPFPVRERIIAVSENEEEIVTLNEEFENLGQELNVLADELEELESPRKDPSSDNHQNEEIKSLENELKMQWECIKNKNYYEIFGLTQNTYAFAALKTTYFNMMKKFNPEKFFASPGEIMTISEDFLSRISEAYNTLSNVVSKERYDELLDSQDVITLDENEEKGFQVQVQFQSGKVFLEEGEYESAEKAFINCINLVPNKPEYYAYLALAIYNNPVNRKVEATVRRAKDLINKSLKYGKLSIAYALKGAILLDEGNLSLSEAEFAKALKINPNNKTALKKMEQISEKRDQENKGLFKKFFG